MADRIKGITIKIGGDTKELNQELKKTNNEIRNTQGQLKDVERLLKLDPSNTELLRQKQRLLNQAVGETEQKLNGLKAAESQAQEQFKRGKISVQQYEGLKREIIATQEQLDSLKETAASANVALQKIGQAGDKVKAAGSKISGVGAALLPVTGAVAGAGVAAVKSADDLKSAVNTYLTATGECASGTEEAAQAARQFEEILSNIYKNNYGESLEDVAQSAASVRQNMRDIPTDQLQKATETAITLRDVYGYDIPETTRAANTLMKQFGIGAEEAFNLIAQGAQNGLDYSGELIDSINEYSVQFQKVGLGAEDMFNVFASGAKNGAFNLDKIGDAVKELSIRVIDGSDTTKEGFKVAGLNAKKMADKFAAGGETAREAFKETISALRNMDDPLKQNIAGVNLFGTMWEDLGAEVVLSMGDAEKAIDSTKDAIGNLKKQKYDDIKNQMAGIGRTIKTDIAVPLGKQMVPLIQQAVARLAELVKGFSQLSPQMQKTVILIGLFAAGLGPLLIMLGQVTTGVGALMKGISAMGPVLAALSGPGGVILLTVAAVGALAVSFVGAKREADAYYKSARELTDGEKEHKAAVEGLTESYKMITESRKTAVESAESQAIKEKKLAENLKAITDENGRIKEGCQEQAEVITGQLAAALGIEIKLRKNQIRNYQDLMNNIDQLIIKKKAEALLTANEGNYAEAIQKQAQASVDYYNSLADVQVAEEQLNSARERQAKVLADIRKHLEETPEDSSLGLQLARESNKAYEEVKGYEEKLEELKGKLGEAQVAWDQFNATVSNYEQLGAAVSSGDQATIEKAITNLTENFLTAEVATRESLERQVQTYQEKYDEMQRAVENGAPAIVETQMKQMQELIDRSKQELDNWVKQEISENAGYLSAGIEAVSGLAEGVKKGTGDVAKALGEAAQGGMDAVKETLKANTDDVKNAGEKIADASSQDIQNLPSQAKVWGDDMMAGYIQGIRGRIRELESAAQTVARTVYNYMHFTRPEKGPLRNYEQWMPHMMEGFAEGIRTNIGQVETAAQETAERIGEGLASGLSKSIRSNKKYVKKNEEEISAAILDAAEEKLKNYEVYNDLTLADEVDFWEAVRKQVTDGTQARIDADDKYFKAKKDLNEKMQKAEETYTENVAKAYENLNDKIQDLNDKYQDAVASRTDQIKNAYGLFDEFSMNTDLTSDDLLNNLESQVDGLKEWRDNLDELAARGIGSDLLGELQELGPKSAAQVKLLTEMTDDELDRYVSLYRQKNRIAKKQALEELRPMQNEIEEQIRELKHQTEMELEEYKDEYVNTMASLGAVLNQPLENMKLAMAQSAVEMVAGLATTVQTESGNAENTEKFKALAQNILNAAGTLPGDMQNIGQNTIMGIITGLQSQSDNLYAVVREIANNVTKTMAEAFEIHSPSAVMREKIGKNLMYGLRDGIKKYQSVAISPSEMVRKLTDTFSVRPGAGNGLEETTTMMDLLSMLNLYLPEIAKQKYVMLDGKAVVGCTAGSIDRKLAAQQILKGRTG